MSDSQVVTYSLDGSRTVSIEITPVEGFVPVGAETVVGHVKRAVEPAIVAGRQGRHRGQLRGHPDVGRAAPAVIARTAR
jgi:hypothetical protein